MTNASNENQYNIRLTDEVIYYFHHIPEKKFRNDLLKIQFFVFQFLQFFLIKYYIYLVCKSIFLVPQIKVLVLEIVMIQQKFQTSTAFPSFSMYYRCMYVFYKLYVCIQYTEANQLFYTILWQRNVTGKKTNGVDDLDPNCFIY